ncbi:MULTISPECIES: hypothetical protein [Luteimonas]|uniref:hypothetical protein n=1 Tax=Luteimonas TaxID=83614 RepID=UPI000C7E839D|nr:MULTISPECIES: hypothetical protein [Luteimonas]
MMSRRVMWRTAVLPVYTLLAGAVFSGAFARTEGSMLSVLATWYSWPMIIAAVLAGLMLLGAAARLLRLRIRRTRAARQAMHAAFDVESGQPTGASGT